jgi:hypothetical protein
MMKKQVSIMEEEKKIVKLEVLDGFDGYEDRVEGDEGSQTNRIIQGRMVKFTNDITWETDTEEIPPDREFVVIDVIRVVQRWKDQLPIETRILAPGEKFPDVKALNAAVPQDEWIEGPDSKLRGPWQAQYVVYLLDPATMDRFTYPTDTTGGGIAVRELVDKTKWMRPCRGEHVYPVAKLSDTFMKTKYGGRQRPHLVTRPDGWIGLDGDQRMLEGPVGKTVEPPSRVPEAAKVEGPSLAEETGDNVSLNDDISTVGAPNEFSPPVKKTKKSKR